MFNLTHLQSVIKSIPKKYEINSPYLEEWPSLSRQNKSGGPTLFGHIAIVMTRLDNNEEWGVTATKIEEVTQTIRNTSHFILNPMTESEDPFSTQAKNTGCYAIRLIGWQMTCGDLELSEEVGTQFKKLISKDFSVSSDEK